MNRPPIPTELKRRILVEAGHRCAIPTCRAFTVEIAHITPWAQKQAHEYENLIALCPNCHTRFDRGEIDKKSMYMYKDNLRYFIEKYSKFELDIMFELARLPEGQGLYFLSIYYLMIKSILEEGFVQILPISDNVAYLGGVKMSPDWLVITTKGKEFLQNFSHESVGYAKNI